jgi:4a-hydroxytetrahydrobiopterin dehydratase
MRCRRVRFSEKSQEDFVILSGPVRLASLAQGKLGGAEGSRGIAHGCCCGIPRLRSGRPARFGVAKRFSGVTRCPVMADLIKQGELKDRMKKIPEWELEKKHIERTFEFDDFADAIDFVNAVAEVAEDEEHHPDIDIRYNKVRLVLSTHSKGGLTELDFGLAERIDTLAE